MTDPAGAVSQFDVVLADDDQRVLSALADMLGDHPGFTVVGLGMTGIDAARLCAESHAHLAVLDVMMPSGGIEGLLAVAAQSPQTAVAFYTAKSDRRTRERLLEAGAVAVFAKGGPIDLAAELYATAIEHCLPAQVDQAPISTPKNNPTNDQSARLSSAFGTADSTKPLS